MTLVMIIMICIGCALILAGLVFLAVRAIGLAKTAKSAGEAAFAQARALVRGGQQLAPKLQELQRKQKAMADQLERLSATTRNLQLLKDELNRATDFVTHIKS